MTETLGEVFIELFAQTLYAFYILLIFFVPFILGYFFWKNWLKYIRLRFLSNLEHVVLEFKMPKEITKSPIAMEVFMNALYQTGSESTWYDKYWKGGMRPWFSLEMVSIEGQVKFFIWTRKGMKKLIETQLYSQYPDVEVAEVPDYTNDFHFDPEKNNIYGCYVEKSKEGFYPIKTYVDYGLDKDPKEELKIDPITPVIEFLGSIGEGEQVWVQIVIRSHKSEMKKPGTWFGKVDWKHYAKEEVKKRLKRDKDEGASTDRLTKGEKQVVEAIEKSVSKFAFDAGIRTIYLAEKDHINPSNIPGLRGLFRHYSSTDLNGLKPTDSTSFDYPWQDIMDFRLNYKKRKMLSLYKKRAFHKPAHKIKIFEKYAYDLPFLNTSVFNVEEIATLYHFPGKVSSTPTFTRIASKKADAPSNLPI